MKKFLALIIGALIGLPVLAGSVQSKFDSGTTSAEVAFGPGADKWLALVAAESDKAASVIKVYETLLDYQLTTAPSASATNLVFTNTGITNSDVVVYAYADGTVHYSTIYSATVSGAALNAALPKAGTTSDRIHEMRQIGQIDLGSNSVVQVSSGMPLFGTDDRKCLLLVADGTSACWVSGTVKRE